MIKTTLKTIIIFLFLLSPALAIDCIPIYDASGEFINCIPIHYEYDRFWWLKDPDPDPWKKSLKSRLEEITGQSKASSIIKDIEVLATMSVLVEHLSPDARKSFHSEIQLITNKILPEEIHIQFEAIRR